MLDRIRKFIQHASDVRYREWVTKAKQGDPKAFGRLYLYFLDSLYRFTFFRINNKEDVEDITQVIFYKAWEKIRTFKGNPQQFKAWLFSIARNTIIDFYRNKKKHIPLPYDHIDKEKAVEDQLVLKHFQDDFTQALMSLTAEQKEVIVLRFIEGMSTKEIARIIHKEEEAVRALQYRALRCLRKKLKDYGKQQNY